MLHQGFPVSLHQQGGRPFHSSRGSRLLIDVTGSLQSWITDRNITVYAPFPENFRCIISGSSECGKTVLLKNLFIPSIEFDKLYNTGPTGKQNEDLEYKDNVLIKDIKELPHPDKLPKDIKQLMIFDDVIAKEPIINEYICRARHENCDMIYLKQKMFSADRQNVRENCILFIFLNKQAKPSLLYITITLLDLNLVIVILVVYVKRCGPGLIITLSFF